MSKFYHLSFSILQKFMLVIAIHWFLMAVWHMNSLSSLALLLFAGLAYLAYRCRLHLQRCYRAVIRHKFLLMAAVLLFQIIVLLSAELLIRRDAAVVFTGAFKYLKESSISSYLTRNPNNIPLFLYERLFFNLFGDTALWIMQGLNLFYANITALILYKGSQKYFSQQTANAVFALYILLVGFSPYYLSMYTDIPPLPLIALQIFLVLGLLKEDESPRRLLVRILLLGMVTSLAFLLRPTVIILVLAAFGILFLKEIGRNSCWSWLLFP
ncbi:membrane protein [Streptococcus sp. DD11]|nr:membrane protein [Streptococcus sp. DD11]